MVSIRRSVFKLEPPSSRSKWVSFAKLMIQFADAEKKFAVNTLFDFTFFLLDFNIWWNFRYYSLPIFDEYMISGDKNVNFNRKWRFCLNMAPSINELLPRAVNKQSLCLCIIRQKKNLHQTCEIDCRWSIFRYNSRLNASYKFLMGFDAFHRYFCEYLKPFWKTIGNVRQFH